MLFVAGAFAALGSLNLLWLIVLLTVAAVLGDTVNYWIGRLSGEKLIANPRIPLKKAHLEKTRLFFEKHGGKTIILARFVPIIRTFAPFVAGAGNMNYKKFIFYNIIGGILWVVTCIIAGYLLGNIPLIKDNFSVFIIGIVVVSIVPIVFTFFRKKQKTL